MQTNNTHIVIMAGGIGSRFWPMSTPDYPKQFIDVMGVGKSWIMILSLSTSTCRGTFFLIVSLE